MKTDKYDMSFTAGSLFHQKSVKIATLFLEFHDWNKVRDAILSKNLLQARTISTSKRVCREICSRLKALCPKELDLLVHWTLQEQGYLLWLSVCRRYKFIADFSGEIIRERYITFKMDLHYEDFDFFFNKKSEWHEELDRIKPTTRNKLRQVLFRMLREANLLTADNTINAAMLSPRFLKAIAQGNQRDLLVFPVFESVNC